MFFVLHYGTGYLRELVVWKGLQHYVHVAGGNAGSC